jgi:sialate O-acetylesterase
MRTLAPTAMLLALAAGVARADVRLPAILGSNMVLQADAAAPFWGWAKPGEEISIVGSWPGARAASATAGPDGQWSCALQTPEAGGPYTVLIEGANDIELTNVLVGEVWLCSGQSNMEWPLRASDNAAEAIAGADHPEIRLFLVENAIAPAPAPDCQGQWVVCSPQTVPDFSAVGYYFGRALSREIDAPIGLIAADWGGTPAESWTSEAGLAGFPRLAGGLELMRLLREDPGALESEYQRALADWTAKYETAEQFTWAKPGFDASGWGTIQVPSTWSGELGNFDGTVWHLREIDIPAAWAGRDLTLELGPIDDEDVTLFNGAEVGAHRGAGHWNTPRRYTVPAKLVAPGKAVIAVSALDTAGMGGINGAANQLFLAPNGASESERISLAGEWRYKKGKSASEIPGRPQKQAMGAHTPSSLYNGMIAPVRPFAIRGAIWYQGESNRGEAYEYRSLFPAMINDWRRQWGYDFPFYFVQIAPFTYGGDNGETAELREAQLMTLALPNTGMAVTMDIGNPRDIHPRNKLDVGERLALWALAKTYAKSGIEYSGPLYAGIEGDGASIRVRFANADGLQARGGVPRGFEVAGEDGKWHAAGAIIDGDSVILSAYGLAKPVAARYAWDDDIEPNLVNGAGLPASPFRSDDWKRITQPE